MDQKLLTQQMDQWTQEMRKILIDLSESIEDTPALGPSFSHPDFEPEWLVNHRLRSGLYKGQESSDSSLHSSAISTMLTEDAVLNHRINEARQGVKRTVYQARLLCIEWTKNFHFDEHSVDFSNGETYVSSRGKTSLYQKLNKPKNWCLTADAEDIVLKVVYNNRGLKKVAMSHLRRKLSKQYLSKYYMTVPGLTKSNIGFEVFASLCRKHLFTYVYGSRAETVPKSSTSRRTINVEPWLNLICQRIIGLGLRKISRSLGNDIQVGQKDHQDLIQNPTLATIDLRSASNSNFVGTCSFMLGKKLFNHIEKTRSPMVYSKEDDSFYHLNMVSAMGCGFTFEIMTIILLAVARTLDKNSRVYGDDIIISNRHASHFCECIVALGYNINPSKTFISSKFRESCGSFFHDNFGYLTAFEIPLPKDIGEAVSACNKLSLLRDYEPYRLAHEKAYESSPRCIRGPYLAYRGLSDLASWVWTHNELSSTLDGDDVSTVPDWANTKACQAVSQSYNYNSFEVWMGIQKTQDLASPYVDHLKKGNVAKLSYYLYNGRVTRDEVRNSGIFSTVSYVCFDSLLLMRYSDILLLTE